MSQCSATLNGKYRPLKGAYRPRDLPKGTALRAVPQHTLFHKGVHAVHGRFQHALQRYTHYLT